MRLQECAASHDLTPICCLQSGIAFNASHREPSWCRTAARRDNPYPSRILARGGSSKVRHIRGVRCHGARSQPAMRSGSHTCGPISTDFGHERRCPFADVGRKGSYRNKAVEMHIARIVWLNLWRWAATVALDARPAPRCLRPARSRRRVHRASINWFASAPRWSDAFPSPCWTRRLGRFWLGNATTVNRLVSVGLSAKSVATYSLTPAGRRVCQAGQPGFCCPAGFTLATMLGVSAPTGVQGRGLADRAWTATAPIAQEPGAGWAHDPRGMAMASDGTALSSGQRFYPITLPLSGARTFMVRKGSYGVGW